jgi:hypothetical protein
MRALNGEAGVAIDLSGFNRLAGFQLQFNDMDNPKESKRMRRTDAEVVAGLRQKLAKVQTKIAREEKQRNTLVKVLLGAGLLAAARTDPQLVQLAESYLTERERTTLRELLPEALQAA